MAAPASVSVTNLTGIYVMNRKQSDGTTPMLKMQKIPWIVQQAAQYSTITVKLRQYVGVGGSVHLDQLQLSTGVTQLEERVLNGETLESEVLFWGKVKHSSRYMKVADIPDEYLRQGWSAESLNGDIIYSTVESIADTWTAITVWGFADVDGERKHVRRVLGSKNGDELRIQLVYDYVGQDGEEEAAA